MAAPFVKVHTSALCIIPPRAAWEQIQQIRCFNDRNFLRWPPHINLLYPFVADRGDDLSRAADKVAAALTDMSPFVYHLDHLDFLEHRASCTAYLGSTSTEVEVAEVQKRLQAAFPDFDELTLDPQRNIRGFRQHLSLGQWAPGALQAGLQDIRSHYKPISFQVDAVDIITRKDQTTPYRSRFRIPLGGAPQQTEVPYVATVGPALPSQRPWSDAYGIGATEGGVWYFAFGANMSLGKLTGSRGITPLASRAVSLHGWALEFNHRGAMGNIIRLQPGTQGSSGLTAAHGVAHLLEPADLARLASMEHEYRPEEVLVQPYDGGAPIPAVAFVTPTDRLIQPGLPPTERYAGLLRTGAREFGLDPAFRAWLDGLPTVPSNQKRGNEYWVTNGGEPLEMLPRIWKGGDAGRRGRGGGRGRGRGGGRGGSGGGQQSQQQRGGRGGRGGQAGRGRGKERESWSASSTA